MTLGENIKATTKQIITPPPIEKTSDFIRRCIGFLFYSLFFLAGTIFICFWLFPKMDEWMAPDIPYKLLRLPVRLLACWFAFGFLNFLLSLRKILKSCWRYVLGGALIGAVFGSQFKTQHIDVVEETSNSYRVDSYTTSLAFPIALIVANFMLFPWSAAFIGSGPVMPILKIKNYINALLGYIL